MNKHRISSGMAGAVALSILLGNAAFGADWPDLSSPPKAIGGGEKDAAVIVGAENYAFVAKVPGARRNAEDWQAYLTDTLQVPSDRVALLRDNEATLEKMRRFVAEAAAQVQDGGTLWFVFIGHGAPSKDGKDGLLVGADAQQDPDGLYARSLPRGELLGLLSKGKQAKTVVLIDACFSGRSSSGQTLVAGLQPLIVMNGALAADPRVVLMTAAKSDQFAGPLPKAARMRPAFSYLALGALRGWAADAKGRVTASAVVDFARRALALDKGRTQTPELTAGAAGTVLGSGRESAPDLGKIDREAAPTGGGFQVTNLPAVPAAEAPTEIGEAASGVNLGNVDVDALEMYDAAVKFDKGESSPAEKAKTWRQLAKDAPKFAETAGKRAQEWDRFAAEKKTADAARSRRVAARDADWKKLGRLLTLGVVSEADKTEWSGQFLKAYMEIPGVEPDMARDLAAHVPAGTEHDALKKLAGLAVDWVSIPGGTFAMGYGADDRWSWIKPAHQATVKPFQLAKTLVTNKQYKACVAAGACTPAHASDGACYARYVPAGPIYWEKGVLPDSYQGDDQPAVCVDWAQAKAYSEWAGGRLPTEAEWEFAARGGGKNQIYPWGDEAATCDRAIMGGGAALGCGRNSTWPVCSKPAGNTQQGLCDMAGNAAEWVQDRAHGSYAGAPDDGSSWESRGNFQTSNASDGENPSGYARVVRGGCWLNYDIYLRSSFRYPLDPANNYSDVGFRPARSAESALRR